MGNCRFAILIIMLGLGTVIAVMLRPEWAEPVLAGTAVVGAAAATAGMRHRGVSTPSRFDEQQRTNR